MIKEHIEALLNYGLKQDFFKEVDLVYFRNRLCSFLKIEAYEADLHGADKATDLQSLLFAITSWAYDNGLVESVHPPYSDLFDTALLDIICPKPSEVIAQFKEKQVLNSKLATQWYYDFSKASNYIRMDRVSKNISWEQDSHFGKMEMTINLSKPEKDPKAIIEAAKLKSSNYPKCLLCYENIGYEGNLNHPARQTHRVIPLTLNEEEWFMQYSPYVYYNEHAIIINKSHSPMKVSRKTFERLCDFIEIFNHYFIGSNADLPLVGGSMLSHDHYQAGNYEMPMAKAKARKHYVIEGYENLEVAWLEWPLSVLRIRSKDRQNLINLAEKIHKTWSTYSDEKVNLQAMTQDEKHHTVTPIARMCEGMYEMDIVLRSNLRSQEHPDGIYHPHLHVHPVKKENIGLIEVMGLAVLPARLKAIVDSFEVGLRENHIYENLTCSESLDGFENIYQEMQNSYKEMKNASRVVKDVIGRVFIEGLEHAGVIKLTKNGEEAMDRFIVTLQGGRV